MENLMEPSIHPYEPFVPEGATKLIIGTVPPPRFCRKNKKLNENDVDFYYGSSDNNFWKLIGEVFNLNFTFKTTMEAIIERKKSLSDLKIGITDIVLTCKHEDDCASDEFLKNIVLKDLKHLLREHTQIKTLIYTSEFVKKQINTLADKKYHAINSIDKKVQEVIIDGIKYDVKILYSPSRNGLRNMGKDGEVKRKKQYKDFLQS